jgi:hypothetical protein
MGNNYNSNFKNCNDEQLLETEQLFEKLATMYINCSGDGSKCIKELNEAKKKFTLELAEVERLRGLVSSQDIIIKQRDASIGMLGNKLSVAESLLISYPQKFNELESKIDQILSKQLDQDSLKLVKESIKGEFVLAVEQLESTSDLKTRQAIAKLELENKILQLESYLTEKTNLIRLLEDKQTRLESEYEINKTKYEDSIKNLKLNNDELDNKLQVALSDATRNKNENEMNKFSNNYNSLNADSAENLDVCRQKIERLLLNLNLFNSDNENKAGKVRVLSPLKIKNIRNYEMN